MPQRARREDLGPDPGREEAEAGRPETPPLVVLQQSAGNAAVARLVRGWSSAEPAVLARAPKAHGATPAPAKKKPYSLTLAEEGWDRPTLIGHAGDVFDQNAFDHAAALYERAYELQKDRGLAMNIYRCYHKLGDQESADHWIAISQGRNAETENAPPVSYQQF
jgi:hypothetical protein